MQKKSHTKILFFCAALMIAALCVPVSAADVVTLTFQDIGLSEQDIDVFDASGAYVQTINTSSVLTLNNNASSRYTLQLKPQASNAEPVALLDSLVAWLTNNIMIVVLIVLALMLIARSGRR